MFQCSYCVYYSSELPRIGVSRVKIYAAARACFSVHSGLPHSEAVSTSGVLQMYLGSNALFEPEDWCVQPNLLSSFRVETVRLLAA